MIVLGLTGSLAMGKSTAAAMFSQMPGVAVHCSDDAVRELYRDREAIGLIATTFPVCYDRKRDAIDKAKLVADLGEDHEKWNALEDILHPFVRTAQQDFLRKQTLLGTKIAVLDIPLLFETGAENRLDAVICVTASPFIQRQRIDARIRAGAMSEADAIFRLSRQMPDEDKRARADYIVQTGQGLAFTRKALNNAINEIQRRGASGT